MAKQPIVRMCALCLQRKQLCKSHYLGKAIHRLMDRDSPGRQVILTPQIITQNPRQLVAHLLCFECEQRLSKFGEAPALQLIRRGDTFPLLDRIALAPAIERCEGLAAYSATHMGIDIEALTYYALSLAWRGSVRTWNTLKGQTTSVKLGVHEEPVRRYLAGEASLPDNVHVVGTICTDEASQLIVNAPWSVPIDDDKYLQVEMFVRGLWFVILAGDAVPPEQRSLAMLRSPGASIYLRDCTDQVVLRNRHFLESAERRF